MASIYTHKSSNITKTWLLVFAFLALVIGIGWLLSYYFQNPNILYIAAGFAIFMNVFSYWFSDKIVLSMHNAKPVTRAENPELWNIIENLSITAGLPMPKPYIIEDPSPNAFATGRNKNHSVVCVTSGLLAILNKNELEGVIAHELSHIGNNDMLLMTIAVVLAGFVSIVANMFFRAQLFGGGRRDNEGGGGGVLIIVGLALSILAPLFATLLQLGISRKREYLADASGALLTRYPEGLASALQKISGSNIPLATAQKADAHLFISNPFKGNKLSTLFSTHPPTAERIKRLREMGGLN